jgi:prevent-host-death family protein
MDEISISEFKAKCLALLEQVNKTKRSLRITRHASPSRKWFLPLR